MDKQSKEKHDSENHKHIEHRLRTNKELDLVNLKFFECRLKGKIFKALKYNYTVTYVSICKCEISDEQVYILANVLQNNKTIATLILSQISSNGIIPICNSLQLNKTITKLTISCNYNYSIEVSIAFANLLRLNKTITFLDITSNILNDSGAIIIAEALEFNNTLKSLDIRDNDLFNHLSIFAICNMLKINKTLEKLSLSINYFSESKSKAFIDALIINNTIMEINNNDKPITEEHNDLINSYLLRNKMIRDSQFWSAKKHHIFPDKCHTTIMSSLLSTGRFLPALPEEIWRVHIFPHFRFCDFT
jgi:Ran GTPase-activating protein (RanGAP) involved in mRNA processing and transport